MVMVIVIVIVITPELAGTKLLHLVDISTPDIFSQIYCSLDMEGEGTSLSHYYPDFVTSSLLYAKVKKANLFGYWKEIQNIFVLLKSSSIKGVIVENNLTWFRPNQGPNILGFIWLLFASKNFKMAKTN